MSHFELFRCDGPADTLHRWFGGEPMSVRCESFLEIADTFPTIVVERIRDAEWTTVQDLGKPERHYCPLHKAEAA